MDMKKEESWKTDKILAGGAVVLCVKNLIPTPKQTLATKSNYSNGLWTSKPEHIAADQHGSEMRLTAGNAHYEQVSASGVDASEASVPLFGLGNRNRALADEPDGSLHNSVEKVL